MIGLYCDAGMIGFAMGAWYLSSSLSNVISGRVAGLVALPEKIISPWKSLLIYQHYYFWMGMVAIVLGALMFFTAQKLMRFAQKRSLKLT